MASFNIQNAKAVFWNFLIKVNCVTKQHCSEAPWCCRDARSYKSGSPHVRRRNDVQPRLAVNATLTCVEPNWAKINSSVRCRSIATQHMDGGAGVHLKHLVSIQT